QQEMKLLEVAARSLQIGIRIIEVRRVIEFADAFEKINHDRPDALLIDDSGLNFTNRNLIMDLAVKNRLPAVGGVREYAEAGGLIAYGASAATAFRRAATYVVKILRGAKPADL